MGVEDHFDSCLHRFNGYDRGMLPRRYWFKITQSILKAKADATKNGWRRDQSSRGHGVAGLLVLVILVKKKAHLLKDGLFS